MAIASRAANAKAAKRIPLIIPVESQVRELDAKLLLACVAARRNFPVVIGRLKAIDAHITSFQRGIYLAKSISPRFIPGFKTLHELGHMITGWDEEALVHLPPEVYFKKSISPEISRYVSHLFAWGKENAELWSNAPYRFDVPVHVTGNPRGDLLRPEMRPFFEAEVEEFRRVYGDYFLINTNFSVVNSNRSLFLPEKANGAARTLSPVAAGMTRELAERLECHKLDIFQRFQQMIPELARTFPCINIVIRPHPSENPQIYHRIAADFERVHVVIKGNVIPWLLAAKATIHNGCTTAIEASLLGSNLISFGPTEGEGRDFGRAWRSPDILSHTCDDFTSLHEILERLITEEPCRCNGMEDKKVINEFLASQQGPLACEKIVDVLEKCLYRQNEIQPVKRLTAIFRANTTRWGSKTAKVFVRKPRKAHESRRAAHHDLSPEQVSEKLNRFQAILGNPVKLRVEKLFKHVYRIHL